RIFGALEKRVLDLYGSILSWFLRWKFVSALLWAVCLSGTIWLFMAVPKTFLAVGASGAVFGLMMGREGSSPDQMKGIQGQIAEVLQNDKDIRATISVTGAGQFVASNQGFIFVMLQPPDQRAPIQMKAGELMGKLAGIPGALAFMRPWPVLEINTGAVAQGGGQYAYAISGVNAGEVYETAGKLMGKFYQFSGFQLPIFWDFYSNTPNLDVAIRREEARTHGVSEARILSLLRTAYAQNYIYLIKKPQDQYQVILEVSDAARSKPEDLG